MGIRRIRVNWWEEWDNSPGLVCLVDKVPYVEDHVYTMIETGKEGQAIYFSELDGIVSFFHHNPLNERGYGGRDFELKLVDGRTKIITGPWSSNSGAVNHYDFPTCIEASITADPEAYHRGYTLTASAVTVRKLDPHLKSNYLFLEKEGGHYVVRKEFEAGSRTLNRATSIILDLMSNLPHYSFADPRDNSGWFRGARLLRKYYGANWTKFFMEGREKGIPLWNLVVDTENLIRGN